MTADKVSGINVNDHGQKKVQLQIVVTYFSDKEMTCEHTGVYKGSKKHHVIM